MRKYFWSVLFLLSLTLAENNAVDFLQTGLSARSMALGNTGVASGGHIDTVFFNPAALQDIDFEFFSAAVQNFEMTENKMFALAKKFSFYEKPLVLGLIYAGSDIKNIERNTLDADERPIRDGNFSAGKNNYTLALACNTEDEDWYGLSLRRYIYSLDTAMAEATALDVGGSWRLKKFLGADFYGGVSMHNIGRTKVYWSTGHIDSMPFGMNAGLAVKRKILTMPFCVNLDWSWRESEELRFSSGLECDLQILALRVGWDEHITYGLGLRYYTLTLDYAQTMHEELGLQQRVALTLYL